MRSHTIVFLCLAYVIQCNVFEFIPAVTYGHHPFYSFCVEKNIDYCKSNFNRTLQNGVREPLGHRVRHNSNCQLLPEM